MQLKQMHQKTTRPPPALGLAWLAAAIWAAPAGATDSTGASPVLAAAAPKPPRPNAALPFPGPRPGAAKAATQGGGFVLENNLIAARWQVADGALRPAEWFNKLTTNGSK